MGLTKIDQVIRQLCRETGEPDFKNYDTILSHVRGALVDLNLYILPSVKTFTLKADYLGNIAWPCSVTKPILVSLIRNGRKCALDVDNSVATGTGCDCSTVSEAEGYIDSYIASEEIGTDIFYRDGNGFPIYGGGFRKINLCSHDYENRFTHIKCRIRKGDTFEFTCVTDGISEGVTHIPSEAELPIGEFVFWKYYRRSDKGLSDRARENYKQETYRLHRLLTDNTIEDWIRAIVRI